MDLGKTGFFHPKNPPKKEKGKPTPYAFFKDMSTGNKDPLPAPEKKVRTYADILKRVSASSGQVEKETGPLTKWAKVEAPWDVMGPPTRAHLEFRKQCPEKCEPPIEGHWPQELVQYSKLCYSFIDSIGSLRIMRHNLRHKMSKALEKGGLNMEDWSDMRVPKANDTAKLFKMLQERDPEALNEAKRRKAVSNFTKDMPLLLADFVERSMKSVNTDAGTKAMLSSIERMMQRVQNIGIPLNKVDWTQASIPDVPATYAIVSTTDPQLQPSEEIVRCAKGMGPMWSYKAVKKWVRPAANDLNRKKSPSRQQMEDRNLHSFPKEWSTNFVDYARRCYSHMKSGSGLQSIQEYLCGLASRVFLDKAMDIFDWAGKEPPKSAPAATEKSDDLQQDLSHTWPDSLKDFADRCYSTVLGDAGCLEVKQFLRSVIDDVKDEGMSLHDIDWSTKKVPSFSEMTQKDASRSNEMIKDPSLSHSKAKAIMKDAKLLVQKLEEQRKWPCGFAEYALRCYKLISVGIQQSAIESHLKFLESNAKNGVSASLASIDWSARQTPAFSEHDRRFVEMESLQKTSKLLSASQSVPQSSEQAMDICPVDTGQRGDANAGADWPEDFADYVDRCYDLVGHRQGRLEVDDHVQALVRNARSGVSPRLELVDWRKRKLPKLKATYLKSSLKSSPQQVEPRDRSPPLQPPKRQKTTTGDVNSLDRMRDRARRFSTGGSSVQASVSPGHQPPQGSSLVVVGRSQALEKMYLRLTSEPDPDNVRPPPVLLQSLSMLKEKWNKSKNYKYTCEQLKSIRQDLQVQGIQSQLSLAVYEFHARIAIETNDLSEYNQCQTQLFKLFDQGAHFMQSFAEFTMYRLLYFVVIEDHTSFISFLCSVEQELLQDSNLQRIIALQRALYTCNYHRFFLLYKECPHLQQCLLIHILNHMRYNSLHRIVHSYRFVDSAFILEELGFDSMEEGLSFLRKSGIHIDPESSKVRCTDSNPVLVRELPVSHALHHATHGSFA